MIGLFGGTFDPVHLGHLILAETCRADIGLEGVWFVPSYRPPHKQDHPVSRFDQRVEMLQFATSSQPLFKIDTIEQELPSPSYTLATVKRLQANHPGVDFGWIIGADTLPELASWHEPQELCQRVCWIVVNRPGTPLWSAAELAASLGLAPNQVRLQVVSAPLIGLASREIRSRVAHGQSIRYQVPRPVEEYIREKKLYRLLEVPLAPELRVPHEPS